MSAGGKEVARQREKLCVCAVYMCALAVCGCETHGHVCRDMCKNDSQ
jgi:hypothetical protein